MSSTDLQVHFHSFAGGRPALAFSLEHLEAVTSQFGQRLAGVYPHSPHVMMRNARLPVYDLAYSGFVRDLKLDLTNGTPQLDAKLVATVHPYGDPSKVIAKYDVTLDRPLDVFLSYSEASRELRWASRTSPPANVAPRFTNDAEEILRNLTDVPEPVLNSYERKVEATIVWNTSNTFVQLILSALPPIDIGEMAPWLTLLDPLQFDFGQRFVIVTSDKVSMTIGDCSPTNVMIEPDPHFPYQRTGPVQRTLSRALVAVYLPKTRLLEFVARNVMPSIMYDTGERGGIIKWRMNGAFGLEEFIVDISDGIEIGTRRSGFTLRGTLSTSTAIVLTGVARAWIDGPCGTRVGLASAAMQGDGAFAADIVISYRSPGASGAPDFGATLEAELVVTRLKLDPNVDIDAVGWPIDDIIGELTDHLVAREVYKLAGAVRKLGKWDMIAVPSWLVDLLGNGALIAPVIESLEGVSSVVGITERPD